MDKCSVISLKNIDKIKSIKSEYVIISDKKYDVDYDKIISFMEENNYKLYALCPYNDNKSLIKKYDIVNTESGYFNFYLESFIIKKSLLDKCNYNSEYGILMYLYDNVKSYYQSNERIDIDIVYTDKNKNSFYIDKSWYLEDMKTLCKLSKECKNSGKNYLFNMYLLKLSYNIRQVENSIINESEYNEFIKLSHEFLNNIDDKYINTDNVKLNININKNIVYYILNIKYESVKYKLSDGYIKCKYNVDNVKSNSIVVHCINYKKGYLYFDCSYDKTCFELSNVNIYGNDKKIDYDKTDIYMGNKIFGREYYNDVVFTFKVKLEDKNIVFKNKDNEKIHISFGNNVSSRLITNRKNSYWNIESKCLKCNDNVITIGKKNTFINEVKFVISEFRHKKLKTIKPFIVRTCYFLTHLLYKNKDIMVSYDKLYKGGDCGEYIFKYISDNTNSNAYYIVNKNTNTYNKLIKNYKNILVYGSLKCKIICLNAKHILASDSLAASFCSFNGYMRDYNKNLFNAEVHCIQHGVTMQNMYHRQNRIFDNNKLYFISSIYEQKNLLKKEYGYNKENLIFSGLARYDGLKSNPKGVILIIPTWRVDVASSTSSGKVRPYNNNFKYTNYFKVYNSLINNKHIIEMARKNNYKIKFLIHPTLISNIKDYDKNDYVEIIPSNTVDYEDILVESNIMITDYSGVQYDFAYMKKPIIYYHNDDLPPSYGNGEMDYQNIGFGGIAKCEEDVVSLLIDIINSNCRLNKKYDKRVNEFFKYLDYNNCKRIYEAIKKYERE